jgi:RHH-type proline utilization regulon transcriptional repressor/proline dehydrogenase/delta 1-pyrroline-5-carboxylate dehydrogenase
LTSGLESLDTSEQQYWLECVKAGNLYVNRATTGAVTLRQPFGGMGKSSLGAGIKAGSPKYVIQFMDHEDKGLPPVHPIQQPHRMLHLAQGWQQKLDWGQFSAGQSDIRKTIRAIMSYITHVEQEFSLNLDYFHLRGQDNILRYLPVGIMVVRLHREDSLFDVLARIAAAQISGCKLRISIPEDMQSDATRFLHGKEGQRLIGASRLRYETNNDLIKKIPNVNRIRYAAPNRVPETVFKAAAEVGFYIAHTPVMMEGSIELLQYYQQQSICNNYHRYGNLGTRALQD